MSRYKLLGSVIVGSSAAAFSALKFADADVKGEQFTHNFGKGTVLRKRLVADDGVALSKKIESPWDRTGLHLRLYQYQTCPFCSKVRAFLDYHGFSYEVVEVNPVTRRQLAFSQYKKVPVVVARGLQNKQLNDSVFIVSLLKSLMVQPETDFDELLSYYPHHRAKDARGKETFDCQNKYFVMFNEPLKDKSSIESKKRERDWRQWVDSVFVHTISPNVYRTPAEAIETFRWFETVGDWDVNFPWWERILAVYVGAAAMYFIGKRLKKKHNIPDDVRRSMIAAGETWLDAMGDNEFMGGNRPDLADLALYGAMTSFDGCATMADLRAALPKIAVWYDRTKKAVSGAEGAVRMEKVVCGGGMRTEKV